MTDTPVNGAPLERRGRLSRRSAIKLLAVSGAGALAPALARADPALPTRPPVPPVVPAPPSPASVAATEYAQTPVPTDAVGGHAGSLASVTRVVNGPGLYVGNEFMKWKDTDHLALFRDGNLGRPQFSAILLRGIQPILQ